MTQAATGLIDDIRRFTGASPGAQSRRATGVPGLSVLCDRGLTAFEAMVYDPVVCLVLQGRKQTRIGDRSLQLGAGDSLIVSHSLPVVSAIVEASPERPYVAMVLAVDLGIARGLYDEIGEIGSAEGETGSLVVARTAPDLLDAFTRLFRASRDPVEAEALAPLIIREIHFRLLQAEHGAMLRQMLWRDSAASRVGTVLSRLRADLAARVTVPEMAKMAAMSVSAFHEHFKSITGMSPLQYRKELRLTEARRLLRETGDPVSSIAFDVGYESPTQFSREYARKFGVPPSHDLARTRAA